VKIISRRVWKAQPPTSVRTVRWPRNVTIWVHHSETRTPSPSVSIDTEARTMRSIQQFHQKTRGWSDIGYNYCIFPSGRIYEGRGEGVVGAHCPGHNSEPGICMIGSYDSSIPTHSALQSLNWLIEDLAGGKIKGHRDGYSTSCPGNALYKRLKLPLPAPQGSTPNKTNKNSARLIVGNRQWNNWPDFKNAVTWIARHGLRRGTKAQIEWAGKKYSGAKKVTNVAKNIYSRFIEEEL